MNEKEIFEKVVNIVTEALAPWNEEEITMNSRLQADLRAESIDYLDIEFRLKNNFEIPHNTKIFEKSKDYTIKDIVDQIKNKIA